MSCPNRYSDPNFPARRPDKIRGVERGEIGHANHVARIDLHSHNSASRACAATYNAIGAISSLSFCSAIDCTRAEIVRYTSLP